MTTPTARRGWQALAAIAAMAIITITVVAFARPGRTPGPAFPPLHPAAASAGWRHLTPNRTAVLSYPPSLRPPRVTPQERPASTPRPRSESTTAGQPRTRSEHVRGALISATC